MKKLVSLIHFLAIPLILVLMLVVVGCKANSSKPSASDVEHQAQAVVGDQQGIYQKGQPIPLFDYSQERQTLIEVYKALTGTAATHTVVFSFGKPIFDCPSIGYPIPATTQLTNPQQEIHHDDYHGSSTSVISQAEPSGVFTGTTQATYIVCVRSDGSLSPVYAEPDAVTYPYDVTVDYGTGKVTDAGGTASVTIHKGK